MTSEAWHILDVGSIWMREFAFAMSRLAETYNWLPETRNFGHWERWQRIEKVDEPPITVRRFPLQRAYARFPVSTLLPFERSLVERLFEQSNPERTALICTTPFYAPVAEKWPGTVVYYSTDLTKNYAGLNEQQVVALDRRMCQAAQVVCPNSTRIADYLCEDAGCDRSKIQVIPNATREENLLSAPLRTPAAAPADIADLPRPYVGVIGNLAGNLDWQLIRTAIDEIKQVSWIFVGPTDMRIGNEAERKARAQVEAIGGRVRFVGRKHYGELRSYARAFDAAFLPYKKIEPTYSGSATRFYEHLAACRPILATRGFHELLSKEPLLRLVDDSGQVATAIEELRAKNFQDGNEDLRWMASKSGTWMVRARDLMAAASVRSSIPVHAI